MPPLWGFSENVFVSTSGGQNSSSDLIVMLTVDGNFISTEVASILRTGGGGGWVYTFLNSF